MEGELQDMRRAHVVNVEVDLRKEGGKNGWISMKCHQPHTVSKPGAPLTCGHLSSSTMLLNLGDRTGRCQIHHRRLDRRLECSFASFAHALKGPDSLELRTPEGRCAVSEVSWVQI